MERSVNLASRNGIRTLCFSHVNLDETVDARGLSRPASAGFTMTKMKDRVTATLLCMFVPILHKITRY
jgi:hypothetical protein